MGQNIWEIVLKIGSISGLLSLIGGIYLYSERAKFRRLNAEKEYKIAMAELSEFEDQRTQEVESIEKAIHDIIRGSKSKEIFLFNQPALEQLEQKKFKALGTHSPAEMKVKAKADYYADLKKHSILWFLKRKEGSKFTFVVKD